MQLGGETEPDEANLHDRTSGCSEIAWARGYFRMSIGENPKNRGKP